MIRTILGHALLLAADALGALPSPERWEAELDALRQQIGDLDAAVADRADADNEARESFTRDIERALGAYFSPFAGTVKSVADLVSEHERLKATNAELRRDIAAARHTYTPHYADRDKMHAALFGAGVKGGPGAWRWHSDPQGTTFSDVAAFCRLMLERLDASAPEEATSSADLAARLDAARDGLRTAQSCLDREGETLVVGALGAIERGLARSAPSLSDITTPKSATEVVREAVAEPTDDDLGRIARAQANSLGYDAAGRALYNLGREHGGRTASAIATESIAMATKWRMAEAENAALLARAEKAERELRDTNNAFPPQFRSVNASIVPDAKLLSAEWQKRGEELEAVRKELCAARSSFAHTLDCVSEAKMRLDRDEVSKAIDDLDAVENGLAKSAPELATVAATPNPDPIDKAAELRAASWHCSPDAGWARVMGLHEDIKEACRGATKVIGGSALGYEWAIHDLPRVVADIVVVLLRDDRLRDELRRRGIHVRVDDIRPRKFA